MRKAVIIALLGLACVVTLGTIFDGAAATSETKEKAPTVQQLVKSGKDRIVFVEQFTNREPEAIQEMISAKMDEMDDHGYELLSTDIAFGSKNTLTPTITYIFEKVVREQVG